MLCFGVKGSMFCDSEGYVGAEMFAGWRFLKKVVVSRWGWWLTFCRVYYAVGCFLYF